MSASRFHRELELPEDPLKRGFSRPRATAHNHYHLYPPAEILNRQTLESLRSLNLQVSTVALFYKRPGSMGIIHADIALRGGRWRKNVAAINWNLSGADSVMRWYAVDGPGTEPDLVPGPKEESWYHALNGIHYGFFGAPGRDNLPASRVRILGSAAIGSATLVRTDLPHAVENTDPARGRWALSVRCEPDFPSWNAAVAAFRPLLKAGAADPQAAAADPKADRKPGAPAL